MRPGAGRARYPGRATDWGGARCKAAGRGRERGSETSIIIDAEARIKSSWLYGVFSAARGWESTGSECNKGLDAVLSTYV